MKTFLPRALIVACLLIATAAAAHAQTPNPDLKKLDGTWVGGVKQPGGKGKSGSGTMVAAQSEHR